MLARRSSRRAHPLTTSRKTTDGRGADGAGCLCPPYLRIGVRQVARRGAGFRVGGMPLSGVRAQLGSRALHCTSPIHRTPSPVRLGPMMSSSLPLCNTYWRPDCLGRLGPESTTLHTLVRHMMGDPRAGTHRVSWHLRTLLAAQQHPLDLQRKKVPPDLDVPSVKMWIPWLGKRLPQYAVASDGLAGKSRPYPHDRACQSSWLPGQRRHRKPDLAPCEKVGGCRCDVWGRRFDTAEGWDLAPLADEKGVPNRLSVVFTQEFFPAGGRGRD